MLDLERLAAGGCEFFLSIASNFSWSFTASKMAALAELLNLFLEWL
jgi:hypothetical protein